MNGFGFSGESNSLPYGDFMDNLVKFLDFPLENVEDEIGDCDVETEALEAFPTEAVLGSCSNIGSDCPNSKSEIPKTQSVSVEETCQLLQPANFPQGMSTRNIPLQNSLSNADTLSPSAEETKPFSSSFIHPSSENQCPLSSSSTALDESCPSDASESLPKATSCTEFDPSKEIPNSTRTIRKKRKQKRLSELYTPLESKRTSPRRPIATESEEVKKNRLPLKTELKKCAHCKSSRTPQWRAGPLGPKTLCNACGVRYRSGRLLPEYRPAASPTFVKSLHSNCHRIVMGMRKGNELPDEGIEDVAMSPSPEFVPMCSYLFD